MWLPLLATTVLSSSPLTYVAALTLPPHPQMVRHSSNASDIPNPSQSGINTTSVVFPETQIHCSGAAYGWDLHFYACIDALNTRMGHDPRPFTFGYRGLPGTFHTLLPARLTSADGHCAYTIKIEENTADEGSMLEMYTAAAALTRKCAIPAAGERGEGGVVFGLGRHGRIRVELSAYEPHIRCEYPRARTSPRDCARIYGSMFFSDDYEHFVNEQGSRAGIVVPWTVRPRVPWCGYTVDVAGSDDSESTAHIWEAMVALDDMCASVGKVGTAFGLGRAGRVVVELQHSSFLAIQ